MMLNKFKFLLVGFLLFFLVIGVVSAEENASLRNPITQVIGGNLVSDENTATITLFDENKNLINGKSTVHVQGQSFSVSGSQVSVSVSLPEEVSTLTISNGAMQVSVKSSSSSSGNIHADVNQNVKTFSIVLKDANGNLIQNKQVSVTINGVSRTVESDGNGEVLISVSLPSDVDSCDISYSGHSKSTNSNNGGDGSSKINAPIASKIKVSSKTFKVKVKSKKLSVSLLDGNNKPIKNHKITLKIKGKTYSAFTNRQGNAIFKITKLNKKGRFTGTVNFAGDSNYKAVSKNVKIIVK